MIFSSEKELVNAYLEKCKKTGWCEITEQDFPPENLFTEFGMPGAGRADLISFNFNINPSDGILYGIVDIIEFKNGGLCRDDVAQINRYYQWIKTSIENGLGIDVLNPYHDYTSIDINLYLIGAAQKFQLDTILLIKTIPNLQILTHKIVNGEIEIEFEEFQGIFERGNIHEFDDYMSRIKKGWNDILSGLKEVK